MMKRTNEVAEIINAKGVKADVVTVEKNGIETYGITLGDGNVRPTLYVSKDDNRDVEVIAAEIVDRFNNLDPSIGSQYASVGDMITDFEKVKDKIVPCLMKAKVDKLATKKFLDLNVFYRIILEDNTAGTASVKISKQLLEMWNITEKELHKVALQNCKGTYGATDMMSMLLGLDMGLTTDDFKGLDDAPMFVVTNKEKTNGAAAMLYPELFKAIANDLDSDLYIIPSSIHELIVVKTDRMSADEVTSMIKEVNATQVSPEEQLSDHVYFYRRDVGKIEKK